MNLQIGTTMKTSKNKLNIIKMNINEHFIFREEVQNMAEKKMNGFIIDLDGTVYAGDELIAGARESIEYLQQLQIPFVFLSNRGNYSREMCKAKLNRFGINVQIENIILSSTVTAKFLEQYYFNDPIWTLGDAGLEEELRAHGLLIAEHPELAEWLVITLHENVTYDDLNQAFRAVRAGARIIATNEDRTFPRQDGDCIDVAAMIGAITYSTGRDVDLVMGKPSSMMAEAALEQLGVEAEDCIVIGDSLPSDIHLAHKANMKSVLVLSGSTKRKQIVESEWQPTWVSDNMWSFLRTYQTTGAGKNDRSI